MHFRGHIGKKGIEIDPDKLPPLRTQKKVRGFLGRLNYIARFISQLTEKCDPIFRFIKKHDPVVLCLNLDYPDAETIHVVSYDLAHLEDGSFKVHDEVDRLEWKNGSMTNFSLRVRYNAVKGSAIADFLASRALEDYESLNFNFPNEDLMYVATTEEGAPEEYP
ncbi:reverse transcriptase [Gossypium australe]|uniref:Reverse transcriptase n=1 Tax=Gossypium australe TaxID=47621 RepID=A0A5B6UXU7_9ROSI|nr:reverse transcriptase [Gossypium australe]